MENAQILIKIAGVFTLGIAVFHLFFWQLFQWKKELRKLRPVNRAVMQVLNICLTLCFFLFGYISLAHTTALLTTPLGIHLVCFMGAFWLVRAIMQPYFFSPKHPASIGMTLVFCIGSLLYFLSLYL